MARDVRLDRLVTVGMSLPDAQAWNHELARINADLGRPKQVNIVVALALNKPQDWYWALEESWVGGKKNDAVLVVSVDNELHPQKQPLKMIMQNHDVRLR
jgi:hypothetical protein